MTEMNKINFEELENVAGGKDVQVHNTSVPYANLRKAPGLDAPIKCKLDNGDWVGTTGRTHGMKYMYLVLRTSAAGFPAV